MILSGKIFRPILSQTNFQTFKNRSFSVDLFKLIHYWVNLPRYLKTIFKDHAVRRYDFSKIVRYLWTSSSCDLVAQLGDLSYLLKYNRFSDAKLRLFNYILDPRLDVAVRGPYHYKVVKCRFTSIGIPIIKIRLSHDRLIFIMGIAIPEKTIFILRWDPGCACKWLWTS